MVLASLVSTSQTGSLELLATQLNNPPALANNSGSTVTVSLTATGQWTLINFATSDPSLVKYKTPVDGNGHVRDKNDEKFGFKYPNLNPGALVGEIKDAKGNTKSTVSGKQQSFELQPGDTISFVINDDPKWYADNTGKLTIAYSVTAKATEIVPTAPGVIANLYNTGVDDARQVLGDSIPDPHYKLTTYPAGTVTPGVTTPNKYFQNSGGRVGWVANTKTARWIGPNTDSAMGPVGDYSYTTTFTLPRFSEALIVGELSADDRITDILINGVSLGNPLPLSSWTTISKLSISKGFVVGTNTIEFKLHNSDGPTGLRIDGISGTYRPSSNKWVGTRLDNQKPEVFTWVDPFWHEIIDGQTIKNNFKEVSNDYSTVVIDQGVGPLFLTADGAYWKGKRFAVGAFEFAVGASEFSKKHETWSGQRPANGGTVAYQFNKATGFWEEANNGVVTKNNFKEVENNKATVTIDQGFGPVYLTLDGAYYNGTKFASGNFGGK